MNNALAKFIRLTQITLVFVYLVIIAGAVVRASGSGMGCPDWPKCFGSWIPPTDVSQLPENYKEIYAGEHHAVAEFNALNTWVEYINRLLGAILGFLIFSQLIASFKFRKINKSIVILSFIEFVLIGFQGWLGAKVVSSNLAPVKITIHMVAALVILSVALLIIHKAKQIKNSPSENNISPLLKKISIVVLLLTFIQIMLGTQVREEVDVLLKNIDIRNHIIDNLGASFKIHRTFSIAIFLLNTWFVFKILKDNSSNILKSKAKLVFGILVLELIAGIALSYFALPAFVQPFHILLACIVYALQFVITLRLFGKI